MHQIERAIFDLRRGVAIIIDDEHGTSVLVQPIEGLSDSDLPSGSCSAPSCNLVVSRHRLASLGMSIRAKVACLPIQSGRTPVRANAVVDAACGSGTLAANLFGAARPATTAERAALALMRRALLLPAALTIALDERQRRAFQTQVERGELLAVSAREAEHCFELGAGLLKRISEAQVPLEEASKARFVLFREPDGLREHLAVLIGEPELWSDDVPVRLHSACLTGDLFGSLRCDCGEQLRSGVRTIDEMGGGVLLYLAQEGRGIGLANKLRAYTLQDEGHDTVEADQILGFGEDERRYSVAVDMLAALEIRRVRLLTNNPAKIRALAEGGIEIAGREKLYGRVTNENRRYLTAKAARSGHWLDEALVRK
ncbi:MAG: GTP cyclohydrolase II [Wenzhouxiangella sp.]|nr:MAG: GTP cyclohydrolase II [Wenzhouxiangella sp.]